MITAVRTNEATNDDEARSIGGTGGVIRTSPCSAAAPTSATRGAFGKTLIRYDATTPWIRGTKITIRHYFSRPTTPFLAC
jgi:hypothetical protein